MILGAFWLVQLPDNALFLFLILVETEGEAKLTSKKRE